MLNRVRFVLLLALLGLVVGSLFAVEVSDDPYEVKMAHSARKHSGTSNKVFVLDPDYQRPKNMTEKMAANGFRRHELPDPREFPEEAAAFLPELPPAPVRIEPSRSMPPSARPSPPSPDTPGSAERFRAEDVLVSIPSARPQRQPHVVTGDDGTIYAVWGEQVSASANAIMFSKSTDGGSTWSTAIAVDAVGTNYSPRVAVWGTGASARVHVVYNYMEIHYHDVYDLETGTYLYTDTILEGDVYYCRSNTGGSTFGHYQAIANRDINLIVLRFDYDEGGADISVDPNGNVAITYYSQADEGHIMSIVIMIILIILFEGIPPFWLDYTWYISCMRASINHGGSFGSEHRIIAEWFMDNSLTASDIEGSGSGATLHCIYTATGILSLGSATSWYRQVRNPFYSPSNYLDKYVADGYPVPAGLAVDSAGNTRAGITSISGWGYDVWYARTTNRGSTWPSPTPIAVTSNDAWEPRIRLDDAQNTFFVWSDERHIDTDIYSVWSEDGGATLRPDQYKVNQHPGSFDQLWPGIGLFLSDSIRRMDVVWWDTWSDPSGDIYYNGVKWWRTNFNVFLHDTLANPMGGTLTLTYWSMDVLISREVSTGYHIIYHDPGTEICIDGISSGSDAVERWILNPEGTDFCVTPPVPGNTYDLMYYNQYYATFTTEIGNPPACGVTDIPSVAFTFEYFDLTNVGFTDHVHWANVRGEYEYTPAIPSDPGAVERWFCPEPNGLVLSPIVAPVYYYQYKATFRTPRRMNDTDCTHPVPSFNLVQRWMGGTNAGGATELTTWADCGSVYEYEDPKNISSRERWDITAMGPTGVVDGLGPYQPGAYHQWKPEITLIGPYLPENPTYCETLYVGGSRTAEANLAGLYSPWADCGSPLWMGEFTSLGWVARDPRVFDPVVEAFNTFIRYGNVVTVILENDFGYGFVVGDGDTVPSGFPLGWAPSTDHHICAVTPQEFGHTRYVFTHWSDGGDTCHDVFPISDTTFTAFFNKEYYLEIISEYGVPWGGGWYPAGATANFGVPTIGSEAGGIRYIFDGWEGTGVGSYTGPDSSADVVMNNPITERATWKNQFRLIVDYTGTDGHVPVQSGSGWYDSGEFAPIVTDSIIGETDTLRYVFSHWESTPEEGDFGTATNARTTIWMRRPYTATAVYRKQWRFTVESTDSSLGSPSPAIGSHWVWDGDTLHATVTSPDGAFYCTGYLGYGSLEDGVLPWVYVVVEQPSGITWMWGDQYEFYVTSDPYEWIMAMASPDPPAGLHYYVPFTVDTFRVNEFSSDMGGTRYRCDGYIGTGPADPGDDTNWVELTMTSSGELRWQFIRQLRMAVTSAHGDPEPPVGVHWFDEFTDVDPNVDPVDGDWRCVGYEFFLGGFPTTGSGSYFPLSISSPCSLNWVWVDVSEVESLYVFSDHGACIPPAGSWTYYLRSSEIVAQTSLYDLSDVDAGIRWKNTGWRGTGVVPTIGSANVCSLTMNTSGTIEWLWQPEYRVYVECPHDNPQISLNHGITWTNLDPVDEKWIPGGANVMIRVEYIDTIEAVGGGDSIVFCDGWTGIGSALDGLDRTSLDLDFDATSACSIFFNWSSLLVPLYVYSDHGDPEPSDTTYWVPGTEITAWVTSPAYDGIDGERWVCKGWLGTGDAPREGDDHLLSFVIYDTSSITWQWEHQYRLRIASIPSTYGDPIPFDGDHWYPVGDSVWGNVTSPVWTGTDTMYCIGYHGEGSAPERSPQIDFGFHLDEPSQVTWEWLPRDSVALLTVTSAHGSPLPYGTTAWRICDSVYAWVNPFVWVGTERIDCIGWRGIGSVPHLGDSNEVAFYICEDSWIQWEWSTVFFFEVVNPGGYGDPEPDEGIYTYSAGAYISGEMRDHPYWTGSDTMYCLGYNGYGNLPATDPHTDFSFNITMNSGLTWRWSNEAYRLTVYSAYGSPWPYGTTYWAPFDWVPHATVDSAVVVAPDLRAKCVGWTGTGAAPLSGDTNWIDSFSMRSDATITWNWAMQYAFNVTNEGPGAGGWDSPVPPVGTHWYNEGDTVVAFITDNPVWSPTHDDSMYCIGMTGSGSAPFWSPQDSIQFVIYEPSVLNWHWLWGDTVARLIVHSEHGSPTPWGTTYWPLYTTVVATVNPFDEVDSVSRYFCTGFDIEGAVDSTDSFTHIEFVIDEHTDLTWNWTGQFFLTLLYDGITTDPVFEGGGWHDEGDTAFFSCETPIFEGGEYFGFINWSIEPDTVDHGDTLIFHSWVVMDEPVYATAHYGPAIFVRIEKDPIINNVGWISVDDILIDSTAIYTSYWALGSYHDIAVSEQDTTELGQLFTFGRWSDALPREHRVGPITDTDSLFIAYYTSQYMAVIAKSPPHTWGFIYADGDTFWDAAAKVFWWSPGPPHDIGVSTPDSSLVPVDDTIRYFFRDWTVTGDPLDFPDEPFITTDSIRNAVSYRANYDPKILMRLVKEPPHTYGYFTIDGDTIRDVTAYDHWGPTGMSPYIGVSEFNIAEFTADPDTVWRFTDWSDGGARVHMVGPLDAPATFTAYFDVDTVILAFSVTPNFWDVGEITTFATATMESDELIVFENDGNVPLDLGFAMRDSGPWRAGIMRGVNRYSLYVHLNDAPEPPTTFSPVLDWVKDIEITWATTSIFGPGGVNVLPPPYSGADNKENLWMQFGSPSASTAGYGAETLVMTVYARYHMP
ncbi:MAG TPA: hypothetical protein ENN07_08005 [candidate division Zixibacteria bacterium]|nr:hypothetical protein [candidate division Zixibacteria bacterium]